MDILIEILDTLRDITGPALWVGMGTIGLLFLYKILVIGSIYGLIRFGIQKASDIFTGQINRKINFYDKLNDISIADCIPEFMRELRRLKGIRSGSSIYIHDRDVYWLREAIDAKIEKEKAEGK